jgi:DegV family protein with EDD domain
MLRIVTDGSADMPVDWEKEYEINVLPLMVRFGEEVYTAGVDISHEDFYRMIAEKKRIPNSSLPAPDQVKAFYQKVAGPKDEILSIHIASKMSGTFSAAQVAARELMDQLNITVFDSGAGSAALGFMCREARRLSQAGYSVNEIIQYLEGARQCLAVTFTLKSLDFARMSGRVDFLRSMASSLLGIHPIIILRDGLLQMAEMVRTRSRSIERILEYTRERMGQQLVEIAVVHAADYPTAQMIKERLTQWKNVKDIIITDLSIPVAANLGPGTVGLVAYPYNGGNYGAS